MRQQLEALGRRLRGRRPKPRILMYHRVADLALDPWRLAVHPERFADQLDVLVRCRTPLPLEDFVTLLRTGALPEDAVAVTFDDGYADNLHQARPALAAAGIPATLFLASGMVGSPRGFWWDELASLVLAREAPAAMPLDVAGSVFDLRLGAREPGDHDPAWRAWHKTRTDRQQAYIVLWSCLKALAPKAQNAAMAAIRSRFGDERVCEADRIMTDGEVRAMIAGGLVKLGGHTAHHPALPTLSSAEQREEILLGRHAAAKWTSDEMPGFAFPYGATCDQCRTAVQDCGFEWACTTDPNGPMHRSSDPFALPRLAVADVDAGLFAEALAA